VAMVSTDSMPLSSAWVDANGEVVLQQHPVDKARQKERGFTKSKQVCSIGTSLLQRVHDHSRKPGSGEKAGRTKSKEEHKQYKALLHSCRKECKEDSECMGFQLMGGTCESIYDLNVAETAKGEDCTRDSDCCFVKVIVLTLDGDDVIVNVAEDDDDDDYEEDDKEEMILLSSNSKPDFSVKYTQGACNGQYLSDKSGKTADLNACKAACKAASSCSFLSFCPSGSSSCGGSNANKCALFSACTSRATQYSGYTTYTKNTDLVTPTPTPTPSGCVEPEGLTQIKLREDGLVQSPATPQTCAQLRSKGLCFVPIAQTTCPCTCPPPPAPSPAPSPSGGTREECCTCVTDDECAGRGQGAFCCPTMKKCSYSGTACYTKRECGVGIPGRRSR